MFENIDLMVVAMATIGFFLGGLLKGVVGMGLPLVAIPIVAIAMPVAQAIPLMLAPGYVMNLIQVRQTWHARTSLLPWWPALLGIAIGIVVGVQIATSGSHVYDVWQGWRRGEVGIFLNYSADSGATWLAKDRADTLPLPTDPSW